jgi:hypothetical protein
MRILLDNGIRSHCEFAEPATSRITLRWGGRDNVSIIHGIVRKAPDRNADYQKQIDALFTVGRLIRAGHFEAYSYNEIECERLRDRVGLGVCNALRGCSIYNCPPAVMRSRFRGTIDFTDAISKGGKKDARRKVALGNANQIAFLKWLFELTKQHAELLISHAALLGLTEFDIGSLKGVEWFQFLCQRSGSAENYPDIFHLWAAERNALDVFLTLDGRLPKFLKQVRNEKNKSIAIKTDVLRPLDLLQKLGIDNLDPVPMEPGRFYHLHELDGTTGLPSPAI